MKPGDLVFYYKDGSQIPCKVLAVHRKMLTLTVGGEDRLRVYKHNCELQDEWIKRNEPEIYKKNVR